MTGKERQLFWQRHMDEQACSGITATSYCEQHGLGLKSFYDWRYRLKRGPVKATSVVKSGFVRLLPEKLPAGGEFSEVNVYLPAGVRMSCGSYPHPKWVADLVRAISTGV